MADLRKNTIRIRMYRVGFGDCFLLSLPTDSGHAHILVDCGAHFKGDIGTLESALKDALEQARNQLAIVLATHPHQDHVSGFGRYESQFRRCRIREVWLPWTEDPHDPLALRLKTKSLALIDQLEQHFAVSPPSQEAAIALANLAVSPKTRRLLQSGITNGLVRYLGSGSDLPEPAGIQGLTVRVLGPPRDPEFLARVDPPQGERFLRRNGAGREPINGVQPFLEKWVSGTRHLLSPGDREALEQLANHQEDLAFALDQAANNSSLVTLFSYRGKHLLFAGDAQYGNWNYWLSRPGTPVLLSQIDFYKVGHHGSFNGTPKKALQYMTRKGFAAMASTQHVPWPSIPFPRLLSAIEERASGLVRSDSIPVKGAPKGPAPAKLPKGFSQGRIWFDYEMPC
jgi:beta-lactamase superfamily II metal-dependent hydrolase